jgi:hypothetical protein
MRKGGSPQIHKLECSLVYLEKCVWGLDGWMRFISALYWTLFFYSERVNDTSNEFELARSANENPGPASILGVPIRVRSYIISKYLIIPFQHHISFYNDRPYI